MSDTFEQFVVSIINDIAGDRRVEYSESLKAFVISVNSWFKRTIYINDLVDEWAASV